MSFKSDINFSKLNLNICDAGIVHYPIIDFKFIYLFNVTFQFGTCKVKKKLQINLIFDFKCFKYF
jgi:hypothetical protein